MPDLKCVQKHAIKKKTEFADVISPKTDRIIRRKISLETIHSDNLWHRGAGVFLFNDKEELLIQRRSQIKRVLPGYFETIVEHVRSGETYLAAAVRGLKEELSLKENSLKPILKVTFDHPEFRERNLLKLFESFDEFNPNNIRFDREEISEIEMLPIPKIINLINDKKRDFTPLFELFLEEYLKNNYSPNKI